MLNLNNATKVLKLKLKNNNIKSIPCLLGHTGIGKTEVAEQLAKELNYELIKIPMSQYRDGDLALPYQDNGINAQFIVKIIDALMNKKDMNEVFSEKLSTNKIEFSLINKLSRIYENPDKKYLLFFDEFNRTDIELINYVMTFIQDFNLNGKQFNKDKVKVMAAMNPSMSMSNFEMYGIDYAVTEMDPAHISRFSFIEVEADVEDWLVWAKENNIHEDVIAFLKDPINQKMFFGKEETETEIACPKSWENLSEVLKSLDEENLKINDIISSEAIRGEIGFSKGLKFIGYVQELREKKMLNVEDVLVNKEMNKKVLEEFSEFDDVKQVTFFNSLLEYITDKKVKLTKARAQNVRDVFKVVKGLDAKQSISYNFFTMLDTDNLYALIDEDINKEDGYDDPEFIELMTSLKQVS